jgi:hypothetical protein
MRIHYKQRFGITLVKALDGGLYGLTSIRPGDKYDRDLGFAIACIKMHRQLPKREIKLAEKLSDLRWKSVQLPPDSFAKIIAVAMQYRQAIGHTVPNAKFDWGDGDIEYIPVSECVFPEDRKHSVVLMSQNHKPICEVAEAFGRRLLKMAAL